MSGRIIRDVMPPVATTDHAPRVGIDERTGAVYVRWGRNGVVHGLWPDGAQETYLGRPPVELVERHDAISVVLDLLADVKLAKPARRAIAEALSVEPEDVGSAAR